VFDPTNIECIRKWADVDLQNLPAAEDERHEYKCSAMPDTELAKEIGKAASGFWNSGGGLLVAGVDGQGRGDGGLTRVVGREPRRDWIEKAVHRVSPQAEFVVHAIEDGGGGLRISAGRAVYLIAFGEGIDAHMAPDNKYYIRAGARTEPGSHFIVEAIRARRGLRQPTLRAVVRRKRGEEKAIEVGIVAVTDVPALDVELDLEPWPDLLQGAVGYMVAKKVPVINLQLPYFFDVHPAGAPVPFPRDFTVKLKYRDVAMREYPAAFLIDASKQLGPFFGGVDPVARISQDISSIERVLRAWTDGAAAQNRS
jgi:hypothetical protein